ncbi:hypothetical protein CGCF415_v004669 [Colletotrichum fructicola]|uniref:Uncharacterized protein n=1 Tax=Colletotrichum fructicola (strain Nara gc5) TaxID=1213859 RepID=L2G600_COLFN|nr:uncharacterized protein CGMCC3_g9589 [Colletotrichum fructicola]KAF4474456.1 hypothetical protein CGGC5_v016669 [Colletotrichum fructicola Nara gc5]KAI8292431.1 hypothetical protein K4K60_005991 [Colletotrichum sp. SAR11_57]KAE9574231.1 hypothetical protein CGMCC3_g9589 [Colletotrichum fructicola]KAF4431515.1 hypothetical protein CFRS1_v011218 [Colletotrichum fructicola]KAF4898850.1 hypothetical protein CGCFRS4_v004143 [Colletotrichum fructicola]
MRPTKSCIKTSWSSDYNPCKKQVRFTEDTIDPRPSALSHTLDNFMFAHPEDMAAFDHFPDEPVAIQRTRHFSTPTSSPVQTEQISTCAPLKGCLKKPKNIELHAELYKTVRFNEALAYDTDAIKHEPPRRQSQSPPPRDCSSQESKPRTKSPDRPLKRANLDEQESLKAKRVKFAVDDENNDSGSDTEEFTDDEEFAFRIEDLVTEFRIDAAWQRMRAQELREWDNYMFRKSLMENKMRNTKTSMIKKRRPSLPQEWSEGVERGVKSGLAGSVQLTSDSLKTARARHPLFRV